MADYKEPFCKCPDEEPETPEEMGKYYADKQDAADRRGEEIRDEKMLAIWDKD
jgi:hypothetical protein